MFEANLHVICTYFSKLPENDINFRLQNKVSASPFSPSLMPVIINVIIIIIVIRTTLKQGKWAEWISTRNSKLNFALNASRMGGYHCSTIHTAGGKGSATAWYVEPRRDWKRCIIAYSKTCWYVERWLCWVYECIYMYIELQSSLELTSVMERRCIISGNSGGKGNGEGSWCTQEAIEPNRIDPVRQRGLHFSPCGVLSYLCI